jgi:hypothetical protein
MAARMCAFGGMAIKGGNEKGYDICWLAKFPPPLLAGVEPPIALSIGGFFIIV